jgi:Ca2+-binding RTX toxin-like protein
MNIYTVLASGQVGDGSTTFSNLQDAVDFASSGDRIVLSPGVIDLESETDGRVIINKDLEIVGAGQDSTFLYAEDSTAESMIGVSYGAEVTFKDFTIDGNDGDLTSGVKVFSGITFVDDSVGTIQNMTIRNIGEDSAGGGSGRGVFLLDSSNVTIINTTFEENERDDVRVAQSATATIIGSTFTAKTDLPDSTPEQTREYGIRADGTSTVTVSGSTFSGYVSVDPLQPSAAIRGTENATLTVSNSTFTNNLNAILIGAALSDHVDLDLTGPIVVNSSVAGAVAVRGQGNGAFTGADQITGPDVTDLAVIFDGGSGDNVIQGGRGHDHLAGGAGKDSLTGALGNDWLDGGTGADTMRGGADNDTYVVDNIGDRVIELSGQGNDTVLSSITFSLGQDVENLTLTGSANINATGNGVSNTLTGNNGANVMSGGGDIDTINGGAGGDILIGGQGADLIDTGAPNDNLVDIVRFSATSEFGDAVFNFDTNGPAGNDRVEFSGILNTNLDDGSDDNNFTFVTGNGTSVVQTVDVGTGNGDVEALLLRGIGAEGVATTDLRNATAVAAAFDDAFNFTDRGNGQDLLLVINDTDVGSNNFSVWQWIQNTTVSGNTAEIDANELTLVGTFAANATVSASSFDFI